MQALADIVKRYRVRHIVIGVPHDKRAKWQIEGFAQTIARVIDEKMTVELLDEDYTSVQAWEKIGNFQKNAAEDTIAAMFILERRLETDKPQEEVR